MSGGVDSTYLYVKIKQLYPEETIPVNCYSPYESSKTLTAISKDPAYIQIKPAKKYDYKRILEDSFRKLPEARKLKKAGKYTKKVFPCCYYIKHKAFLKDPLFKEEGTIVVSGIKSGDGNQRRLWLYQCRKNNKFIHKHKTGQLYFYPFRDYMYRELPEKDIEPIRALYPSLAHSGCVICPVLLLFNLVKQEPERYHRSVEFARRLGIKGKYQMELKIK